MVCRLAEQSELALKTPTKVGTKVQNSVKSTSQSNRTTLGNFIHTILCCKTVLVKQARISQETRERPKKKKKKVSISSLLEKNQSLYSKSKFKEVQILFGNLSRVKCQCSALNVQISHRPHEKFGFKKHNKVIHVKRVSVVIGHF